jgi:hypothetical protein
MSPFTQNIKTVEGTHSFYFNPIHTITGTCYHISLLDKNKKAVIFLMESSNGGWKLSDPDNVPYWIEFIEKELSETIVTRLLEASTKH